MNFSINPWTKTRVLRSIFFRIRFKAGDHFPIVRRKHFTVTEIFAFVGGLLGLFLGISVITFAEVLNEFLQLLLKSFLSKVCFKRTPTCINNRRSRFLIKISKVTSYFDFFLKESSIHSFNFIANARNSIESIFWCISFIVSMTGCVFIILQLYRTMDFKAVTLLINDKLMEVSEIPFPAITIFGRFSNEWKLMYPYVNSIVKLHSRPHKPPNMTEIIGVEHPCAKYY